MTLQNQNTDYQDQDLFSARFRQEREASWRATERALDTLQSGTASREDKEQATLKLPAAIRELHSSLSVARSISLDRPMIAYLDSLASRAALMLSDEQPPLGRNSSVSLPIYGPKPCGPWAGIF